jgi:hypothetical protein
MFHSELMIDWQIEDKCGKQELHPKATEIGGKLRGT